MLSASASHNCNFSVSVVLVLVRSDRVGASASESC